MAKQSNEIKSSFWERTKEIAAMYTGTFIVVLLLNQLVFFGFCLNPICIVAAMPHCLAITAVIGTWLNRKNNWGGSEGVVSSKLNSTASKINSAFAQLDESAKRMELESERILLDSQERNQNAEKLSPLPSQNKAANSLFRNSVDTPGVDRSPTFETSFAKYGIRSLWHLTHRDNVASIVRNGLLSHKEIQRSERTSNIIDILKCR